MLYQCNCSLNRQWARTIARPTWARNVTEPSHTWFKSKFLKNGGRWGEDAKCGCEEVARRTMAIIHPRPAIVFLKSMPSGWYSHSWQVGLENACIKNHYEHVWHSWIILFLMHKHPSGIVFVILPLFLNISHIVFGTKLKNTQWEKITPGLNGITYIQLMW
jgi:hypothetical protein